MSAMKSVFRELRQAVLDGMAHSKDKLHQLADNLTDHLDNVIRQIKDQDNFDAPPALTGNSTDRVDRTTTELLYRSDDRDPATVFEQGFQVLDPSNNDLDAFVTHNGPSNFISTTRDEDLYMDWGSRYRYTVDAPGGIDVDATMPNGPYGPRSSDPESEVAFQGGIPTEHIVGAHPTPPGGTIGEWIPNPNYGGKS